MLHSDQLAHVTWECVHFTDADDAVRARGLLPGSLAIVDAVFSTEQPVLESVAKALRFPDYFGGNWNAFDECLRDLEWLPAPGYVLFLHGASALWQREPRSAGALVESWLMAAEDWAGRNVSLHLVFVW